MFLQQQNKFVIACPPPPCSPPQQSKYKGMNKDQWYNVLEFSRTINTDLSNYDEDGACEYKNSSLTTLIFQQLHSWKSRLLIQAGFTDLQICTCI